MKQTPRGIRATSIPVPSKIISTPKGQPKPSSVGSGKSLVSKLIAIAGGEVGVRERGGNNCGSRIRDYQTATNLTPDAWPWCTAFVDWCVREWLNNPEVVKALNLKNPEAWRPKTAGAFDMINWAKEKGVKILHDTEKALAGDLVVFDFSHIGLVIKDQESPYIETVEGNTNGKGDRDSVSGDGVWKKTRHVSLVKAFIRIL